MVKHYKSRLLFTGALLGYFSVSLCNSNFVNASSIITEYPVTGNNQILNSITLGQDGNLWFSGANASSIGRISNSGTVTQFPLAQQASIQDITDGPDQSLWFTEVGAIGKISLSGNITQYNISNCISDYLNGITFGPDGNLWFTSSGKNEIGVMTPEGNCNYYTVTSVTANPNVNPEYITVGSDGALWFTEGNGGAIGRITTDGNITQYPVPAPLAQTSQQQTQLAGIASGGDGNIWFTANPGYIAKISPSTHQFTVYSLSDPNSYPVQITQGSNNSMWFSLLNTGNQNMIGRIDTNGNLSYYTTPTQDSMPSGITSTSDGNIWFTEQQTNAIGILNPSLDNIPPVVAKPSMSSTFAYGQTITFSASASDMGSGVSNGEFYVDNDPGRGHGTVMRFANGKISGSSAFKSLNPGRHILYMRAQDNAGNWSDPVSVAFYYL